MVAAITDEFLESLYFGGLSTADIARRDDVPLSQSAVHRRLQRSGALEKQRKLHRETAERYAQLYRSGMSIQKIIERPEVSERWHTVRAMILSTGTAIRPVGANSPTATPKAHRQDIDTAYLRRLYEVDGLSLREIADQVGIYYSAVHSRLATAGVRFRSQGLPGHRPPRNGKAAAA